ncbi:hypothetical protein QOT17_021663 [Balamuthia mandrillaris]
MVKAGLAVDYGITKNNLVKDIQAKQQELGLAVSIITKLYHFGQVVFDLTSTNTGWLGGVEY